MILKSNVDHEHTTVNGHTVEKDIFENTGFTTTTNILTTIQTATSNNVTCTLNEDGTYILDGTASAVTTFIINCTLNIGVYQLVGCPENGSLDTYSLICKKDNTSGAELAKDLGDGSQVNIIEQTNAVIYIRINKGYACNNLVFKPMLTTDLQAKYSDYVPYTGNLGNLNADVSKIVQQLDGHTVNADVPVDAVFTDTNTWRPVETTLSKVDLNTITTPGFYNAGGGNNCTNKPSGVEHFGMIVIHRANGSYYTQIIFNDESSWRRICGNGIWGHWLEEKLTDTTYEIATTKKDGLMSVDDKKKLDSIDGTNIKYVEITQSEYDKLATIESNVVYFIKD